MLDNGHIICKSPDLSMLNIIDVEMLKLILIMEKLSSYTIFHSKYKKIYIIFYTR